MQQLRHLIGGEKFVDPAHTQPSCPRIRASAGSGAIERPRTNRHRECSVGRRQRVCRASSSCVTGRMPRSDGPGCDWLQRGFRRHVTSRNRRRARKPDKRPQVAMRTRAPSGVRGDPSGATGCYPRPTAERTVATHEPGSTLRTRRARSPIWSRIDLPSGSTPLRHPAGRHERCSVAGERAARASPGQESARIVGGCRAKPRRGADGPGLAGSSAVSGSSCRTGRNRGPLEPRVAPINRRRAPLASVRPLRWPAGGCAVSAGCGWR